MSTRSPAERGPAPDGPEHGPAPDGPERGPVTLTDPVTLAGRTAPSRVVFGPHETNLGHRRSLSARHVAYYQRRAAGGAGVIITETASVHPSDWPYERAPLAADCPPGWREIAAACHPAGALVLAGLGHTGLQGSSAYSQAALWAPSRFTDPVTRETPRVMEQRETAALVEGFAAAAAAAVTAGLDGVEIDAGPGALLRQFHSGLTNQRTDGYGTGRLALTRQVLTAVRAAIGGGRVLALRLSCDELAPWAGVTPDAGAAQAAGLAPHLDLLTVVRGGPYSASAYRPDGHTPPMFNAALAQAVREAVAGAVPVVLQGSVVDPGPAQAALAGGVADLAEMTRAQIADAALVRKLRTGEADQIRPCLLCNQACRVRDSRNPLVSCVADPRSGHETLDAPDPGAVAAPAVSAHAGGAAAYAVPQHFRPETPGIPVPHTAFAAPPAPAPSGHLVAASHGPPAGLAAPPPGLAIPPGHPGVLVVGGGPAGLEAARVAALAGCRVRLAERAGELGGALRTAARIPGRERLALLVDWLEAECRRLGVTVSTGTEITAADLDAARAAGTAVVLATGSRPVPRFTDSLPAQIPGDGPDGPGPDGSDAPVVLDALAVLSGAPLPPGPVVVHDPVGGPAGVGVAEWLAAAGRPVAIVTQDQVAGTLLSLAGDLADANVRLQRAGVSRELRSVLRGVAGQAALLEDPWTGERRRVGCAAVVDCGHRLPEETLYAQRPGTARAGDCVAPRTAAEAVLEGRRRALELVAGAPA